MRGRSLTVRFAATIFVSATLLFACQPMVARMIVPLLGGAPAVWIVCSLCFQALVLAGYLYAHLVGSRVSVRTQVALQIALVGAALLVLPVTVDERLVVELTAKSYSLGVLVVLLKSVGLPFFVLSTSAPLVQRWFAEAGEKDPYFLYAASNAGSMLALLGYPFLVEPVLGLSAQTRALQIGYVAYAVLVGVCAFTLVNLRRTLAPADVADGPPATLPSAGASRTADDVDPTPPSERWRQRLVWVALAFAPSSLLLGATQYITTDIASVPLLWVLPLAVYLASFIVAFAKKELVSQNVVSRALAFAAAVVTMSIAAELPGPAWLLVLLHVFLLFAAAVACHRALANRRPHVSRLTEFYLLLSVGGVLGGIFNGLVAPVIFSDLYEYPIALGLACLGRAAIGDAKPSSRAHVAKDVAFGVGLAVVALVLVKLGDALHVDVNTAFLSVFGLATAFAFTWSAKHPVRYAVGVGGILLAAIAFGPGVRDIIHKERDFFGVLKVRRFEDDRYRILVFGTTIHGAQKTDPATRRSPVINFFPTGPAGDLLGPLPWAPGVDASPSALPARRIGVIGLGIGGLTGYARPGDEWTYFELNPTIVRIAKDHYTFLKDMPPTSKLAIETGDARLRLRDGAASRFDILVMDAFSSDAIPVHLMTREAIAINLRALAPGGLLIAHISNRHVRLAPVVAALAKDAGLHAIARWDGTVSAEEKAAFKVASHWVAMSTSPEVLDAIKGKNTQWKPLEPPPGEKVWTDDFSDLLGAMKL